MISSGWPFSTSSPAAASTFHTDPGMGEASEPAAAASSICGWRGCSTSDSWPASQFTCTAPHGSACTAKRRRWPPASRSTWSGARVVQHRALDLLAVHLQRDQPVHAVERVGHHQLALAVGERDLVRRGGHVAPAAGRAGQHRGVLAAGGLERQRGGGHRQALLVRRPAASRPARPGRGGPGTTCRRCRRRTPRGAARRPGSRGWWWCRAARRGSARRPAAAPPRRGWSRGPRPWPPSGRSRG